MFTGYGALPASFAAAVSKFCSLVDAQDAAASAGYHASAVLETAEDEAPTMAAAQAALQLASRARSAVKLLIGWTSREAHLQAKASPGGEFQTTSFIFIFAVEVAISELLTRCNAPQIRTTVIQDNIGLFREGLMAGNIYLVNSRSWKQQHTSDLVERA